MRILAIGDFHGKFPKKFNKIIKKEKIDLVISIGDYPPFYYRKLWFKHCFRTNKRLWEVIGKEKYKKLVLEDYRRGEQVLKKLNSLNIPVFTIFGNIDSTGINDYLDMKRIEKKRGKYKKWSWEWQDFFSPIVKKYRNITRIDYRFVKFKDFVLIGSYGGTNPGHVKSPAYRKYKAILEKLFNKFRKENKQKKVIFVSHNPPHNTKIDKLSMKAHPDVSGKHYGSKMVRRIIEKYQPILTISGHIHEAWGVDRIKKTLCVNTGAAYEGRAAIITLPENKKEKLRVKFIN